MKPWHIGMTIVMVALVWGKRGRHRNVLAGSIDHAEGQ
jgi:hypothetical protein